MQRYVVDRIIRFLAGALALLLLPWFAYADNPGPIDPFPLTGAYSANFVRDQDHVSIIEIAGDYNRTLISGQSNAEPRAVVAQEFFRTHPDEYDFLVVFSTFEFDTGDAVALHWGVQNKVQGIGLPQYDNTELYGSDGKLQGYIDMAAVSRWSMEPLDPAMENTLSTMAHETLHQWSAFVKYKDSGGSDSEALLGRDGAHWSYLLDTDASVLYGSDWKDNGDGTFTSVGTRTFFSPLDLYLMGMYSSEEVPPMVLIENSEIDKTLPPQENVTISGTKQMVTIEDIIAAEGPRIPSAADSQKEFRFAFILVTGQNEEVSSSTLRGLNDVRNAFMTRFAILTGGRAVAHVYPQAMPTETTGTPTTVSDENIRLTPASYEDAFAWLRGRQQAGGYWEDKTSTRGRDTAMALELLTKMDGGFAGNTAALNWLSSQTAPNTDYLSRHALAVVANNGNATTQRDALVARQNSDGGWGISSDYRSNPQDTALALLALSTGGGYGNAIDKGVVYLESSSHSGGGWSGSEGGPARITATTLVLQALKASNHANSPVVAPALAWLKTKQNLDGGFGDNPSTVHDTANVLNTFIDYEVLAEIDADASAQYLLGLQTVAGNWSGSNYATVLAVKALRRFNFPNWAIEPDISVIPISPRDGERAKLSVVIKNDTKLATPAGVLRFYEGDPESGGTQIGDDIAVPLMAGGSSLSFSQMWDSFDKAGDRTLYAVVDPDSSYTEMSEKDNQATATVTVQESPPGIDLDIDVSDITMIPAAPNKLPTSMGMNVTVRNIGVSDANAVRILVWDTTAEPKVMVGEASLDVAGRSTMVANFPFTLARAGTSTYAIELDPDNTITEASESNNSAIATVTTAPTVDLVVTPPDLSVDKSPLYLGDDVVFSVKLHNNGTTLNPAAEVKYLVTDGVSTTELLTNTIEIPPGGTIEHKVPWRVDMTGNVNFTVQLDPDGLVPEIDTFNNTATLALTSGTANGPNLVTSYNEFTTTPNPGNEGYAMTLSALVRNTGNQAANDIEIAFYNGDPQQGGVQIGATQTITTLAVSESATVQVQWDQVPTAGDKLLFVVVDPANSILEFSEDDNSAFNVVPVLSLPDLAISSGDIQLNPAFPTPGQTLTINAQITNLGQQDANNIVVRAYLGEPALGGTLIGETTIALIEGTAAGMATFNTTLSTSFAPQPIVVQVDPDDTIFERVDNNNTAQRSVAVQNGDFYVNNLYISPNGDGVKDNTTLFFRLSQAEDVALQIINVREKVVRTISGNELKSIADGSVEWDGLDDLGRLVPDGDYRLRLINTTETSLGEVTVNVDTNRSSLLRAANTRYELNTNLTCALPDVNLNYTEDDEYAYFIISSGSSPDVVYPRGVYRMAGNGTDIRPIVPESFFGVKAHPYGLITSDDGELLIFNKVDYALSVDDPDRITRWLVEDDGSRITQVAEDLSTVLGFSANNQYIYSYTESAIYRTSVNALANQEVLYQEAEGTFSEASNINIRKSPNLRYIAFTVIPSHKLKLLDVETSQVITLDTDGYLGSRYVWSHDGEKLAVVIHKEREAVYVFNASGDRINTFEAPETLTYFNVNSQPSWSLNSIEFAISLVGFPAPDDTLGDNGGIYVANLVNGSLEKHAEHDVKRDEGMESYHVLTWDGGDWIERGVLHYGMRFQDQQLDLSSHLPDPDGEYKVRIFQTGKQAAHVEHVYLSILHDEFSPEKAVKLPNGFVGTLESLLGMGQDADVLDQVQERDAEVLDLHEAGMELHWHSLPPGPLSLHLVAREEDLRNFKTLPFSYPEKSDASYRVELNSTKPMVVDGQQQSNDQLGMELFKVLSKPDTGHPSGYVYGYVSNDAEFLYASLDFTVDNTLDGEEDWGAVRVNTNQGWKEYRVTVSDTEHGQVGFSNTAKAGYRHKYYEFKIPLKEIGAVVGDSVEISFQAYGTAAIIPTGTTNKLPRDGELHWVPGTRALFYETYYSSSEWVIYLDEDDPENKIVPIFGEWPSNHYTYSFSPTGRKLLFKSALAHNDPSSICYETGVDTYAFESLLNMVADLRATSSALAGGIRLRGTASDLNFTNYLMEYTPVEQEQWQHVAPASGHDVVDDEFTTWVPPGPGRYFVRLTVNDSAGNSRRVVRRVSWSDSVSITDLYREPPLYSPNGDLIMDIATFHYRVLEPVHLEFNFYNADGKKVRTISRDHAMIGAEYNLVWDGRDNDGLLLPDGKYTLRVQDYEFSIEIDVTPPAQSIHLYGAYDYIYKDYVSKIPYVHVNPRIEWQVSDPNIKDIEDGGVDIQLEKGDEPGTWESLRDISLNLSQTMTRGKIRSDYIVQDPQCTGDDYCNTLLLPIETFVNSRFLIQANDKVGNSNSSVTQLGKEELIVSEFGQLDVKKTHYGTINFSVESVYTALSRVVYAPMDDLDGADNLTVNIAPRQTRFTVYETIRDDIVQMDVQYKELVEGVDPNTVPWTVMPIDGYLVGTGDPSTFPVVSLPPEQHQLHVMWTPFGLKAKSKYIVRLRTLDSLGDEYFSNVFSFSVGGYAFNGLLPDNKNEALAEAYNGMVPPFNDQEEIGLWGEQWLETTVSEVQLFVQSDDDPRYAVPTLLDSVLYPGQAFVFRSENLQSCVLYSGYVVFYGEEDISGERPELGRTGSVPFKLPCVRIGAETKVQFAQACGDQSPQKVNIELTPISSDGSKLTLLTLSRIDQLGEESLEFNVNNPESDKSYSHEIDTSALPEGEINFTARIVNENEDESINSFTVTVDHNPATLDITYPLEGQRVCGIPTVGNDGVVRNVVTMEGNISDNNNFHYLMSNGLLPENVAVAWHDSRSKLGHECGGLDSKASSIGSVNCGADPKVLPDLHISQTETGPIAAIFDVSGDVSARLHVYDSGGYQQCMKRSFYLDAGVEAFPPLIDRTLISPNGDAVLDELKITHEVDESVFLDIDIHKAVLTDKGYIKGDFVGNMVTGQQLLPGFTTSTWDGTDGASVLPDGHYYLVVTYRDACGNTLSSNLIAEIDATPPVLEIAYPTSNSPLQMMVEVLGTVVDGNLQSYRVDYGIDGEDNWIKIGFGERNIDEANVLASWNTNGLSGDYAIRLSASDTAGNQSEVIVPLTLAVREDLLTYLESVPYVFSPNEDGKREHTAIRVGLSDKMGNIVLNVDILDPTETVKKSLASNLTITDQFALNYQWDGRDADEVLLPDGVYTARVKAELASNAAVNQTETVQVVVDSTPPLVEVSGALANGYIRGDASIVGTISDQHISQYDVDYISLIDGASEKLRSGSTNTGTGAVLGTLQGLAEGEYQFRVVATDEAENKTEQTIKFTVDNTPPKVVLDTPGKGTILSATMAPIKLTGLVEDPNLAYYTLNIGAGNTPNTWTELIRSEQPLTALEILTVLDVSVYQDGPYTLELIAQDKAGNSASSKLLITIDNTAPDAAITAPAETGYVKEPLEILGTAADINMADYKVFVAPGEKSEATLWSEVGMGSESVQGGKLIDWSALPPDGINTLKLVVKDQASNSSEVQVQVNIDTHPPSPPVGLAAEAISGQSIQLTWDANSESDVAGYHVYRDGEKLTTTPVTDSEYLDSGLTDNTYEYTVTAVDLAEWESTPSEVVTIRLDTTPPSATISQPSDSGKASGFMDVRGTAYSEDDFKEYRLYAGSGAVPTAWQLLRKSPVPVLGEVLSEWNTVVLGEGETYVLRLEAEDISGNIGTDQVTVSIDNLPPAAPTGLVVLDNGSDVNSDWNDNAESDLLGYLIFRNERLANVQGAVIGDLKPHAISPSQYLDAELPDGVYSYTVHAIDEAGNISDPSLPSEVTIDTRPPHAVIVEPEDGQAFDNTQYLLATSEDSDIEQVQYQYRAEGETDWIDLGSPDSQLPYEIVFDPTALGLVYGKYELRAVATDLGGKVDTAPEQITVSYQDLTPPDMPDSLVVKVNGGDITLTWNENTEGDLAGYHIDRIDQDDNVTRITSSPIATESYVDDSLDDAIYSYRVVAIDVSGNESDPSTEVVGVVYTPIVKQLYTPVLSPASVSVSGNGIVQSTLSGELNNLAGTQALPVTATDTDGGFVLPEIELADGINTFTVVLTDATGNVSKQATVTVEAGTSPSQPQGLNVSAVDYDVTLNWDDNAENNLIGYRIFRNGESLLSDVQISGLTATSSYPSSRPEYAVDGNENSYWHIDYFYVESLEGQWLAVELPEPRLITRLEVDFSSEYSLIVDYDIEAWTGSSWVKVAEVQGNNQVNNVVALQQPYYSSQLRIVARKLIHSNQYDIAVSSIRVLAREFSATAEYLDSAPDGNHSYTVTAVNNLGFESIHSDPATVPVGDVEAPEAVTLSAAVFSSDVLLNWDASSSLDVVKYNLYRDGELIAEHSDLGALNYTDAGRPNGTYVYTVKAVDAAGNESLPSNEESVTIVIALLPAPINLTVTAVPAGSALDLAWIPAVGSAPVGYRVMRATNAGGPYSVVADVSDVSYRDTELENGLEYFYVVAALDAPGNTSAYSDEVSGIPEDAESPDVFLYYPTVPGKIFTTDKKQVTVNGLTEPGAVIKLYNDGIYVSDVTAESTLQDESTSVSGENVVMSPDGKLAAIYSESSIYLYEFSTAKKTLVVSLNTWSNPSIDWLSDSSGFIYLDLDYVTGYSVVRKYHVINKESTDFLTSASADIENVRLSPDSKTIAVTANNLDLGITGIFSIDVSSGQWKQLVEGDTWIFEERALQWSPEGGSLLYQRSYPDKTLEVVDVDTGVSTILDNHEIRSTPSWSPNGKRVAAVSARDGEYQVWVFDVIAQTETQITSEPYYHFNPIWTRDGKSLIYYVASSQPRMDIYTFADSNHEVLLRSDPGLYFWYLDNCSTGYLGAVFSDGYLHRLSLPGSFTVKGVQLHAGDNVVTATAADEALNTSLPSEAINITREVGDQPDLSITQDDLRVIPAAPLTGETARVTALVRNLGAATSPQASISLLALDSSGDSTTLAEGNILNPISAGGAQAVAADWNVSGDPGAYTLVAIVDQYNTVDEVSESNNLSIRDILVTDNARPNVSIAIDKDNYSASEDVVSDIAVSNNGELFSGSLVVTVEDRDGRVVQEILNQQIDDLAYSETRTIDTTWNTGQTFAGEYQIHTSLLDGHGLVASDDIAEFTINAITGLSSEVTTDRAKYGAGENVRITGSINYADGNSMFSNAISYLRLVDGSDNVLAETSKDLGDMLPNDSRTVVLDWNTGTSTPGIYTVELEVQQDGEIVTNSSNSVQIDGGARVSGTFVLSEITPSKGTPVAVNFTVQNLGNTSLLQQPILVNVVDPDLQDIVLSYTDSHDIAPGMSATGSIDIDTSALSLKNYSVVLQTDIPGVDGIQRVTLHSANMSVVDREAPVVVITKPTTDGYIRGDASVLVSAKDADSKISHVDISVDGGQWQTIQIHDTVNSLYGILLPGLPEGQHQIQARATDSANNTSLSSVVGFTVDNTPPDISIAGVSEDGVYNTVVTPVITITEDNLAEQNLSLNASEYVSGTAITTDGNYTLTAQASDLAGNVTNVSVSFIVDTVQPDIVVTGVVNDGLYNTDVIPEIQVTDANLSDHTIMLDGQPYTSGTPLSVDGKYLLEITAVDIAGNQSNLEINFEIDKAPPVVTIASPNEGDTLNQTVTDVTGTTEPEATVHVTLGGYNTSVLALATGEFSFTDIPLEEGLNTLSFYAVDKAGNIGNATTLNLMVSAQNVELHGTFKLTRGYLIYAPMADKCNYVRNSHSPIVSDSSEDSSFSFGGSFVKEGQDCNSDNNGNWGQGGQSNCGSSNYSYNNIVSGIGLECIDWHKCKSVQLLNLLESVLQKGGRDYLIVSDKDEFASALRSQRYGTVVIIDDAPLGSDVGSVLRKEIKAQVASGGSFILLSDTHGKWKDIVGAKPRGVIHGLSSVELPDSPASNASTYSLVGTGQRVRLYGGIPVGTLNGNPEYPAMVLNSVGSGNSIVLNYDPSEIISGADAEVVMTNVITYATSSRSELIAGEYGDLTWKASELNPPQTIELDEELSAELSFVEVFDGVIASQNNASWEREITTSEDVFSAIVKLPFQKGEYQATVNLYEILNTGKNHLIDETLEIDLDYDRSDIAVKLMNSLSALNSLNLLDRIRRDVALHKINHALGVQIKNKRDVEYILLKLLYAYEKLEQISVPIPDELSNMGMLIRAYQLEWHALDK